MGKRKNPIPSFEYEQQLWSQGYQLVAGMDEVGRGAFAGPIVAAAVILPPDFSLTYGIADSKLLTAKKRAMLSDIIKQNALCYSVAEVSVAAINRYGVGKANFQVFRKAIHQLFEYSNNRKSDMFVLVDGFHVRYLYGVGLKKQQAIIKGDQKSLSIAAASILAKVYRDTLMETWHERYAVYNFKENKGYGTAEHRRAIKQHGLCDLHRTSFSLGKFL